MLRSKIACLTGTAILVSTVAFAGPSYAAEDHLERSVQKAEKSADVEPGQFDTFSSIKAGESESIQLDDDSISLQVGNEESGDSTIQYGSHEVDASDDSIAHRFTASVDSDSDVPQWTFSDDVELLPLDDGRVTILDSDGELVGGIEAPWAVDAKGNRVPTSYSVEGNVLKQEIETDKTTSFPVVADPTVKVYPAYIRINLNRKESVSAIGSAGACAAIFARSPHPSGKVIAASCGVITAIGSSQLAGNKCISIHVAGVAPPFGTWWPTFPKCKK